MKKIFLSVVMSALFLIGSLSMISMAPPPPANTTCQAQYQFLVDVGVIQELGLSKGQFISLCNVCLNKADGEANQAVCQCKLIDAQQGLPDGVNFGQCVNLVKNQ